MTFSDCFMEAGNHRHRLGGICCKAKMARNWVSCRRPKPIDTVNWHQGTYAL